MVKVKATITTDVEYIIDADINDGREVKRKLMERLAIEGFVNNDIEWMSTDRIDGEDDLELDIDISFKQPTYMYGKF